jgi:predicted nuclease with TOPRIM domain
MFKQIVNFPLENHERAQGLLRKLRLEISHLRSSGGGAARPTLGGAKSQGDEEANRQRLLELEQKLIENEQARAELVGENNQSSDSYEALRDKFGDVVKGKALMESELIDCEEERLKLSKLVLDLRIELSDAQELAAGDK